MIRRFTALLIGAHLVPFACAAQGISSWPRPLLPALDCSSLEASREESPVAYSAYARCVLHNSLRPFHFLYLRHLRDFPLEKHDVEVRFTMRPDGTVQNSEALSAAVTDVQFLRKIAARVRLVNFKSAGVEGVEVSYTFPFSQMPQE
jgi:hypothetical protein